MLKVGDSVATVFSGRRTLHTVTHVRERVINCQSGTLVRVMPEVPGSLDPGNIWNEGWIDVAWFEKVPEQQKLEF